MVSAHDADTDSFKIHVSESPSSPAARSKILSDPGYGRHFTDHMATATWNPSRGWHKRQISKFAPLALSPAAAVLHYGQAVFEGLKVYRHPDGSAWSFRVAENARRFQQSTQRIVLPTLSVQDFMASIRGLVALDDSWIPDDVGTSLYVRPFMFADEGFLGNRPAESVQFCLIASPAASYFDADVSAMDVWVSTDFVRASPGGTGEAKFAGNYAASLAAQVAGYEHGCQHVLFVDAVERRWVEELGTMNVFAVHKNGSLVTPPLGGSILHGITRSSVIQLGADLGLEVVEAPIDVNELVKDVAREDVVEVFACGTAAIIAPIRRLVSAAGEVEVSGWANPGSASAQIRERLLQIQHGLTPDTHGWMHRWTP